MTNWAIRPQSRGTASSAIYAAVPGLSWLGCTYMKGQIPGIPPVAIDLVMGHHGCPKRVTASGLHVRGVKVPPSHTLAFLHGVLFCTRCGCYCVKIVQGLSQGCKMKPTNPVQASVLKRLLQGEPPHGMTWPDFGAQSPGQISTYLALTPEF